MYAAAMKSRKEKKSRAVANTVGQKKKNGQLHSMLVDNRQGSGFVDKRRARPRFDVRKDKGREELGIQDERTTPRNPDGIVIQRELTKKQDRLLQTMNGIIEGKKALYEETKIAINEIPGNDEEMSLEMMTRHAALIEKLRRIYSEKIKMVDPEDDEVDRKKIDLIEEFRTKKTELMTELRAERLELNKKIIEKKKELKRLIDKKTMQEKNIIFLTTYLWAYLGVKAMDKDCGFNEEIEICELVSGEYVRFRWNGYELMWTKESGDVTILDRPSPDLSHLRKYMTE